MGAPKTAAPKPGAPRVAGQVPADNMAAMQRQLAAAQARAESIATGSTAQPPAQILEALEDPEGSVADTGIEDGGQELAEQIDNGEVQG